MAFQKGDIARNTYDKDVSFYPLVLGDATSPKELAGLGMSLTADGVKKVENGETFIGVMVNNSQRNCGNYDTSVDAWNVDVINDGFVYLEVSGTLTLGALVTVADGGVFSVTTDVAKSIGQVTCFTGNLAEVELSSTKLAVAGVIPDDNGVQGTQAKPQQEVRGEQAKQSNKGSK